MFVWVVNISYGWLLCLFISCRLCDNKIGRRALYDSVLDKGYGFIGSTLDIFGWPLRSMLWTGPLGIWTWFRGASEKTQERNCLDFCWVELFLFAFVENRLEWYKKIQQNKKSDQGITSRVCLLHTNKSHAIQLSYNLSKRKCWEGKRTNPMGMTESVGQLLSGGYYS